MAEHRPETVRWIAAAAERRNPNGASDKYDHGIRLLSTIKDNDMNVGDLLVGEGHYCLRVVNESTRSRNLR